MLWGQQECSYGYYCEYKRPPDDRRYSERPWVCWRRRRGWARQPAVLPIVAAICAVLAYLWFAGYVTEAKPNRRLSQKGRRYTRQGRTSARPSCGSTCAGGVAVDVMAVYRPGLQSSGIPPPVQPGELTRRICRPRGPVRDATTRMLVTLKGTELAVAAAASQRTAVRLSDPPSLHAA